MNTVEYLKWGLRLFFWVTTTMAIAQGSVFAVVLCVAGFLIIEHCLEDIND